MTTTRKPRRTSARPPVGPHAGEWEAVSRARWAITAPDPTGRKRPRTIAVLHDYGDGRNAADARVMAAVPRLLALLAEVELGCQALRLAMPWLDQGSLDHSRIRLAIAGLEHAARSCRAKMNGGVA